MRRALLVALLAALVIVFPARAAAEQPPDELLVTMRAERALEFVFGAEDFAFSDGDVNTKQNFSVILYYQNLYDDAVELKDILSCELVFRDKFRFELDFVEYRHVIDPSVACLTYPLEPVVEILGVWALDVPNAVATASAGELALEVNINGSMFIITLL